MPMNQLQIDTMDHLLDAWEKAKVKVAPTDAAAIAICEVAAAHLEEEILARLEGRYRANFYSPEMRARFRRLFAVIAYESNSAFDHYFRLWTRVFGDVHDKEWIVQTELGVKITGASEVT